MANNATEIELLKPGMTTDTPTKGVGWIQNLYVHNRAWTLRPGFGQVAQIDCSLMAGFQSQDPDDVYNSNASLSGDSGFRNHLGSYYLRTDFDHEQIISVFSTWHTLSGNSDNDKASYWAAADDPTGTKSFLAEFYVVSIYDITTDTFWEEVLYPHTSELAGQQTYKMPWRRAVYSTSAEEDYQAFAAPFTDKSFYFTEFQDVVYFGNEEAGLFAYRPTIFKRRRNNQAETFWGRDPTKKPFGETSKIVSVYFVDGFEKEAFTYLTNSEIGKPNDIAVLGDRLCYVVGRTLYFSDVNLPNAVNADNFILIPSQKDPTAIEEINGNLLIFTESETFLYLPAISASGLISGGRMIKINDGIGCHSSSTITKVGNHVAWLDKNGVYTNNGTPGLTQISTDIDNLFTEFLTNPLTSYYYKNGETDSSTIQPRHNFNAKDLTHASLSYDIKYDLLFVCVPSQNYALVYKGGGWSIWNFESVLTGGVAGATFPSNTTNILNPWIITTSERVFLIGSAEQENLTDLTKPRGSSGAIVTTHSQTNYSYYILEWGKGGALDRTKTKDYEDSREFVGEWDTIHWDSSNTNTMIWAFEKPKRMPVGWKHYAGDGETTTPVVSTTTQPIILVPLTLTYDIYDGSAMALGEVATHRITDFDFTFYYDNEHWEPILMQNATATGALTYYLPNERRWCGDALFGGTGYGVPAMGAGRRVQLFDNAGVPTADPTVGNRIQISADIANLNAALNTYYDSWMGPTKPGFNFVFKHRNPVIYLPFKRKATLNTENTWNIGVWIDPANTNSVTVKYNVGGDPSIEDFTAYEPRVVVWKSEAGLGFENPVTNRDGLLIDDENLNTQPVDWCYKSEQVGIEGQEQVRARGLYSIIKSTGKAATGFISNAFYGIFNTLLGSDWKGWTSQVIDFTETDANTKDLTQILDRNPIRTRTRNTNSKFHKREWKYEINADDQPGVWSSTAAPTTGDFLIDDQEVDELATSDSVKGKSISYMLFGFANNIAEKLQLDSVKAALRRSGGRRRKGRSG